MNRLQDWPRAITVTATFGTCLLSDEYVMEVVTEALTREFGEANNYTVTIAEVVS
jgi:hypothetical protein